MARSSERSTQRPEIRVQSLTVATRPPMRSLTEESRYEGLGVGSQRSKTTISSVTREQPWTLGSSTRGHYYLRMKSLGPSWQRNRDPIIISKGQRLTDAW